MIFKFWKSVFYVTFIFSLLLWQNTMVNSQQVPYDDGPQGLAKQDGSELVTGQQIEGSLESTTEFQTVKMLKIDQMGGRYLFFFLSPINSPWQKMKIGIFRQTNLDTPLKVCKNIGIDACYLDATILSLNEVLVVGINCGQECNYQFYTYWTDMEIITPGQTHKFTFTSKGKAQLYHVNLSNTPDFKELRVIIKPETRKDSTDSIKFYGNMGAGVEQPSSQKHDFESIGLMNGGEGIFLSKEELKGQKIVSLVLIGQTKNVFVMTCQVIKEQSQNLLLNTRVYEHLKANSEKMFMIDFKQEKKNYDEFQISVSKLQGDLNIKFYVDRKMTKAIDIKPFEFMKDSKYILLKTNIEALEITEMFMMVGTMGKNSLTSIQIKTRAVAKAVELTQNTYDFLAIPDTKLFVIHFQNFYDEQIPSNTGHTYINVNIIRVVGVVQAEFRFCKNDISQCLSLSGYQSASTLIKPINNAMIGMKSTFKLEIDSNLLTQINEIERAGVIIAVLKNGKKPQECFAAVEYVYANAILELREDHPYQQLLDNGQIKHYRFAIADPSVVQVRVHVYEISGGIKVMGTRSDPRLIQSVDQISSANNIVMFNDKFNQPMYVTVEATKASTFSIIAQVIRHNEYAQLSSVSISEDISYTFRIKPNSMEIIKANPIFNSVYLKFRSTGGSVGVCLLNKDKKCDQEKPVLSKSGQFKIQQINNRNPQILLLNPSNNKYIQVVVSYHSADYTNCDLIKVGQFYSQTVNHQQCFNIQIKDPVETIAITAERIDIGPLAAKVFACYQIINKQWTIPRFLITKEDIEKGCQGKNPADRVISLIFEGDEKKENQKLKVQFTSQYKDGIVNLLDGVAYRIDGSNREGVLKAFYYKLVNLMDTRVVLRSFRGQFKFFVKIIQNEQRQKAVINYRNKEFQSTKSSLFQQPTLLLKLDDFMKTKCQICGILIGVQSQNPVGDYVDFSIQVVQDNKVLKDNEMVDSHLMKSSIMYYEYQSHKEGPECNIIVQISDHNQDCTKIYLSDTEVPSENNFLAKEDGSKLTYPLCHKGHYYVAVEAIEDCAYSITASNSLYNIIKAERGNAVSINMKETQLKYIIFRHITQNGFKIITMEKFGKVTIFAEPLTSDHLDLLKENKPVTSEFRFKSTFSNILSLRPQMDGYCSNCYYLAAVYCEQETQAAVLLADQQTKIRLVPGKILNDELFNKDQTSNLSFFGIQTGSLPLNVYNGEIQITLEYKKYRQSKTFQKSLAGQAYEFKLSQTNEIFNWEPINIQVKCKTSNCIYSIGLIDAKEVTQLNMKIPIVPGKPSYLFIDINQTQCVTGYAKTINDELIVTASRTQTKTFQQIKLKLTVDGKVVTDYKTDFVSNIMVISFIKQSLKETVNYQLCITSLDANQELSAIVQQGKDVNLLAEDVDRIVKEENTFVIYPGGPFIVDIFECQGDTTFKHSTNELSLQNDNDMDGLTEIGMPEQTHAIKLNSYLPTYLRIKSPLSIIRWMPINQPSQIGVGYLKYAIGNIKYQTSADSIIFLWDAISKTAKTNTTVIDAHYRIYFSNEQSHLKSASQCQKFLNDDIMVMEADIPHDAIINSQVSFKIQKEQIKKKFENAQNVYMNIVADMALAPPVSAQLPNPPTEFYRFIYHQQQIPEDVFSRTKHENEKLVIIIGIIAASVLGVLILAYVFMTKVVPIVSRIRNNAMMIEDHPPNTQASKESKQVLDENPIQSNERIIVDIG